MSQLRSSLLNALLFLALGSGLVACGEDKKEDPAPVTTEETATAREQLITGNSSKNWMLTAWTTNQQGVITDSYLTLNSCDRDDISTFFKNKGFRKTDGQLKCDPNSTQLQLGTWALQKNETELKLMAPVLNIDVTYRIKQLNATTMILDLPVLIISPGDTIITTYTFTAQ